LNELDEHQFRAVVANCFMNETSLITRIDDRIRLMNVLLKKSINKYVKTQWFKVIENMVNEGLMEDLFKLQEFIYADQTFNNWIIDRISINKKTLFGPRDRFSYMKFGEFISADMLFMAYFESKNEDLLNKFIAVLYRNADIMKKGVDCREDFDSSTLDERTKLVAKLDEVTKQAIVYNYSGVRKYLTDKYSFVFNSSEEKNSKNIQLGKKQNGWMDIRRHLAGDVLKLEKVDNVFLHDVLADLNEKISEE
jgi:hypothetical protein